MSIIVNHVMSSDTVSGIFTDLLSYYKRYCDKDISIVESCKAIDSADIYHYHRPHLEIKLKENSVVTIHHDLYDTDPWLDYDKFHHRYMEAKKILCLNSSQQRYVNDKGLMNTEIIPHGYNSDIFNGVDSPKKIKFALVLFQRDMGERLKEKLIFMKFSKGWTHKSTGLFLWGGIEQ